MCQNGKLAKTKAVWIVTGSNPSTSSELLYRTNGFLNLLGINIRPIEKMLADHRDRLSSSSF